MTDPQLDRTGPTTLLEKVLGTYAQAGDAQARIDSSSSGRSVDALALPLEYSPNVGEGES